MKRLVLVVLFLIPSITFGYISPGQPKGFINDFAGILKPETVTTLNQKLEQFSKETGNEISVVTISKLGDETVETYAEKLFQEWGIGKEKEDNGLLLLISIEDREMRIEVGYGLEAQVTDIGSGRVIREILTPAFQAGDFDRGIIQAVDTITRLASGEAMPTNSSVEQVNWSRFFPYAIFIIVYLAAILGRSKSWWAGGAIGGVVGVIFFSGIVYLVGYVLVGLIFDFIVSRAYSRSKLKGGVPPWWIGGGGLGGGPGGFGGFGGGMSGGGGASGRW